MTTQELIDQIEKNRQAALFAVPTDPDAHGVGQMNPVVADALDAAPAPKTKVEATDDPAKVNVTLGGALGGAKIPFTPGVAETQKEETTSPLSFYDMLLRSDAVRQKASEAYERNEKSNRARTRIAAIADALSSLGNLVGTTYGAFNQPQTYQTPFVTEQVESDRARARQMANMLYQNENSLRLAQQKYDMQNANLDRQLAVQDAITQRAYMNAMAREALADKNAAYKSEQIEQQGQIRKDVAKMNAESAERRTATTAGTSRANKKDDIKFKYDELEAKKNGEIGASGGVGGYTVTETETVHRDDMGNITGKEKTKTRTGKGGTTTTTTSTKTPPSKQKKDEKKTPPSKRK